jgi:uncharacterized protein YcbK (DUF882 family)
MKITSNFSLSEFAQPARHGFPSEPYPEKWITARLEPLCWALETIRSSLGNRKITILSGYRSEAYNRCSKIRGARNSQHVHGRAADFVVEGVLPSIVQTRVLSLCKGGFIRIGGLGNYPGFTHIDVRPGTRLVRWSGSRR